MLPFRIQKRLRVAEVLEATDGGTLTHLDLLVKHIDHSAFDVRVVWSTARGVDLRGRTAAFAKSNIPVAVVNMVRRIDPMRDAWNLAQLYWYLRRHPVDVVHTHSSKAGILGRIAARLAGVPLVLHTPHGFAFQDETQRWLQPVFAAIERFAGRLTDVMVCVSNDEQQLAIDHRLIAPERTLRIYNSIDPSVCERYRFPDHTLRETLGLAHSHAIVGTVANLRPEKGLDDFVRAAHRVCEERSDVAFLIVGAGALESQLRQQIDSLGLTSRVFITKSSEPIWKYLALMDVFVSSSLREGLPYAILEAMAMRRPIVATDVTGSRELIRDGDTGLLVPARDDAQMAHAISSLLDDAEERSRYAAAARALIDTRHHIRNSVAALQQAYCGRLPQADTRPVADAITPAVRLAKFDEVRREGAAT